MAFVAPARFLIAKHGLFSAPWQTAISVSRMDGMPDKDRFGEAFKVDRTAFLTEDEAIQRISTLMRALPAR